MAPSPVFRIGSSGLHTTRDTNAPLFESPRRNSSVALPRSFAHYLSGVQIYTKARKTLEIIASVRKAVPGLPIIEEMGLTNVKLMVPFCRTVEEGKKVLAVMAEAGLQRGEHGLEVYVMCEIPANVIFTEEFAEIFDGFSIGSNDLTQLTLGLDRDSAIVAHLFDERNASVMRLVQDVIRRARACGRKVGICGQAPSDYPEFARFLVRCGDRKSTRLNSSHIQKSRMPSSA